MKTAISSLSLFFLVVLAASSFVQAEREEALQIYPQLKGTRKIIAGLASFLSAAQSDIILSNEGSIRKSISEELALLQQLTGEDVQASGSKCVEFIRQGSNVLMKLTGVAFSNCFNDADDQLFNQLSKMSSLQLTREQYEQFNLLGAFRGENIFVDPSRIRDKLSIRLEALINLPTASSESLDLLRAALGEIKTNFQSCMAAAQARLADNLKFSSQQVRTICAGELLKQV